MVEARGLAKTFTRKKDVVEAVKGIDLHVDEGELVAFLGPNGAGKSTTMRMLTSLLTPTSGSATVAGYDVVDQPDQVRSRIGYIGQGNAAGHSYRVIDELHNQGRFYSVPKDVTRRRAVELIEALELTGLEKRTVASLSGGQRRRLDVAMGLMNQPSLLFLDEPTTGLDPHARANLWEHILNLREQTGMTMLLTTHYLDEADSMAERVVLIDHGEVIADATPDVLKRDHADDRVTLRLASADGAAQRARTLIPSTVTTVDDSVADGLVELNLHTANGPELVPPLLQAFTDAGLSATSVDVKQASLDDVFLNLTGRSLREEAA
ncbi:putative ABC transporter ATP-binding protein [Gordonia araii NBRC 100433]|uniref:Putative ABC transporter ATP-binding protein n=1 Tax=Gordonia araii NBRC 100433 TaxID=1073574 RepID=G7GXD6_9ACTN|nr:ABC transporter ATP-binding protein [Gordonia araii]NNG95953.1 ABC transporter ATP-binding protein [Gordonia araii NBRC 100433]GAB08261.1 putative ABC transporter ATP-binding protein [Gordonia araii NBRC 100433]